MESRRAWSSDVRGLRRIVGDRFICIRYSAFYFTHRHKNLVDIAGENVIYKRIK